MGLLHRSGVCALALIAGAAALQIEPAVVRDLVFDNGHHRAAVGAVRVPLWSAALAQSPDTFTLENVTFAFGPATYEAKRIEFSGVTSSRAEIEALFSPTMMDPMAVRLARISARRITFPEIRIRQELGPETQIVTYRNVVLSDVAQGRIATATVEATGVEAAGAKDSTLYSYGHMSISDLDMRALAHLYEAKADSDAAPLTRIYGAFTIDNVEIVENGEGVSVRIARMSGRDFMARPTRDSWAGTTALFAELGDGKGSSKEDAARLLPALADFLGAFDIGLVEATGIETKAKTDGKASPTTARIDRIAYSGGMGSKPSDARLEGMEIVDQNGRLTIDAASITGFSIAPTLDGLKSLQGKSLDELDAAAMRGLVPKLGTLRLSGLDIDTTDGDTPGKEPERIKASLKSFELAADSPVNAIPTDLRLDVRNFALMLPNKSTDDGIKELLALGYETIDMSMQVAASWNEAANEIALKEVSIEGEDMGRISLAGLLGDVSRDVFDADTAVATVALMDAKAKSVDLTVQNDGLFERYLAQTAKEQKTTPEALRRTYASATAFVMPSLIGNSDQAKNLSKAVARFIAQPGKLTVNAQAKEAPGLGLTDILLLSDPQEALKQVNITAKAE